jgi:hypothetical protein
MACSFDETAGVNVALITIAPSVGWCGSSRCRYSDGAANSRFFTP